MTDVGLMASAAILGGLYVVGRIVVAVYEAHDESTAANLHELRDLVDTMDRSARGAPPIVRPPR